MPNKLIRRPQMPRGLRCRSVVVRLLGLWVRNPPKERVSVCCECYVLSCRGLRDELSLVQRNSTNCGALLCMIWKPQEWGGPGPRWAAAPYRIKSSKFSTEEHGSGDFQGASTIAIKSQQNSSSHGVVHNTCIVYSIGPTTEPTYSNTHTEAFINNFEGPVQ